MVKAINLEISKRLIIWTEEVTKKRRENEPLLEEDNQVFFSARKIQSSVVATGIISTE
jgi:hypothetical protein